MNAEASASQGQPRGRATILVIEDQLDLRLALGDLLREEGFRVVLAADGPQAIAVATLDEPDVVVTDLRLPGTDGLDAVQQIKAIAPLAQFIVHSWYDDEGTRRSLENEGIHRYIVKGSSSRSVVQSVEQALADKRATQERTAH